MYADAGITGCRCTRPHECRCLIVLEKILTQLSKRSVVIVKNVATRRKQLNIFGYNIAGIKVNHGIVGYLWVEILIVAACILAGNVLQIAAQKPVVKYFVFSANLKRILRNAG